MENELELEPVDEAPRALHFEWLAPILFHPRKTLDQILQKTNAVWQAPMLVLTLLVLVSVIIAAPIRQAKSQQQANGAPLPESFQYLTPDEQSQFKQGMQVQSGPVFTYVLPGLSALGGLWIQWILLGSLLHLALTLSGSRGSSTTALNLAAWAALPQAIRMLVQSGYMLVTHQMVASPGLSGFVSAESGGLPLFFATLLSQVDLYFLWMVALLLVGVVEMSGLKRARAWIVSSLMILLVMALQALPTVVMSSFSGLGASRFFF